MKGILAYTWQSVTALLELGTLWMINARLCEKARLRFFFSSLRHFYLFKMRDRDVQTYLPPQQGDYKNICINARRFACWLPQVQLLRLLYRDGVEVNIHQCKLSLKRIIAEGKLLQLNIKNIENRETKTQSFVRIHFWVLAFRNRTIWMTGYRSHNHSRLFTSETIRNT